MLAIDLCAGSGWAVACRRLGISELGIEIMPEAIATRDAMGVYTQNISISDLPNDFCRQAPLQIAGPPCQTFSAAGKGEGRRELAEVLRRVAVFGATGEFVRGGSGDPRTWLVLEPLRLAIGGMPRLIVWEQVPAILPVWQACGEVLRSVGYSSWTGVLDAADYGVPAYRRRAILLARLDAVPITSPIPTHTGNHVSMFDALGWGMVNRPYPTIACSRTTGGPDKEKVGGSGARRKLYEAHETHTWVHGPGCCQDGSIRLSLPEAAALQTFPADHPWQGTKTAVGTQIGNAVPPLLAYHILRTFL